MSWTEGEDMDYAKSLLARREAEGHKYGRWLNARVRALIEELERLRAVEAVANKILDKWEIQEARAVEVQRIAARARAAQTQEERCQARADMRRLDSQPRVSDFGDLRMDLGEALGR